MIKKKVYFHVNYNGNGGNYGTADGKRESYTKISVYVGETDGHEAGLFTVIQNNNTKRIEVQKRYKGVNKSQYCGSSTDGLYVGVNALRCGWDALTSDEKANLLTCGQHLLRSCAVFLNMSTYNEDEKCEIKSFTFLVKKAIEDISNGILTGDIDDSADDAKDAKDDAKPIVGVGDITISIKDVPKAWKPVAIAKMNLDDATSIMQKISENGNPADGVLVNGKKYKLDMSTKPMTLLEFVDDEDAITSAEWLRSNLEKIADKKNFETKEAEEAKAEPMPMSKPVRKRTQKRIAFIKDAKGLTDFVQGGFYKLGNTDTGTYVSIYDDDGFLHCLKRDRIEVLEIYDEPPIAENEAVNV